MATACLDAVALLILDIRDVEVEQRGLGRVRPTPHSASSYNEIHGPEAVSRAWPQIGWGGTTTQRHFDVLQAGETDLALHESR